MQHNNPSPSSPLPSAGVILAYFNIYLQNEKELIDKKNPQENVYKEEVKTDTTGSYYSLLSSFLQSSTNLFNSSIEGIKNTFKSIRQTLQATIDHVTGTDEKLKKIYTWLLNKLDPENSNNTDALPPDKWTWDHWLDFAIELRHKGSEAQQAKTTSGQSRCCEVFFALADDILVTTMQNTDGSNAYVTKVRELHQLVDQKEKLIYQYSGLDSKTTPNAAKVKEFNKEIDKLLLKLCYLGDLKAILKASTRIDTEKRVGLLDHLLSVVQKEIELNEKSCCHNFPKFNETRPYPLQWHFARICFKDRKFHNYAGTGYVEFVQQARLDYQNRKSQDEEKKKFTSSQSTRPEPNIKEDQSISSLELLHIVENYEIFDNYQQVNLKKPFDEKLEEEQQQKTDPQEEVKKQKEEKKEEETSITDFQMVQKPSKDSSKPIEASQKKHRKKSSVNGGGGMFEKADKSPTKEEEPNHNKSRGLRLSREQQE